MELTNKEIIRKEVVQIKSKYLLFVISVLLFVSISANINNYFATMKAEHVYMNLVFTLFKEIDLNLKQLSESSGSNAQAAGISANILSNKFASLDQLLSDGTYLLDSSWWAGDNHVYAKLSSAFSGTLEEQNYNGHFLQNGIISDNERKFINQLSADIKTIEAKMVGKDGLNINPDLTKEQFILPIKTFSEIWGDRNPADPSPYNYLKKR